MKSIRIRSFSGPYFPAFGLNTKRCGVSLRIQFKCGKIWTRKTPNTDTFHAVVVFSFTIIPFSKRKYIHSADRKWFLDNFYGNLENEEFLGNQFEGENEIDDILGLSSSSGEEDIPLNDGDAPLDENEPTLPRKK